MDGHNLHQNVYREKYMEYEADDNIRMRVRGNCANEQRVAENEA